MPELLPFSNINSFTFEIQPIALPADLRPLRKISQIILVLKTASRSEKSSFLRLQLFNWAFASTAAMDQLTKYVVDKDYQSKPTTIHLDPAVNRAVQFALAEGLLAIDSTAKLTLTPAGQRFASMLLSDETVLEQEKRDLRRLAQKVTEAKVLDIVNPK